ncbi:MAG: hypothetical protein PHQ23_03500 [Candidatus Wallbacteria bacterium]|nr:hypothetical protein [Candidatus Wallbacteria bacterium]
MKKRIAVYLMLIMFIVLNATQIWQDNFESGSGNWSNTSTGWGILTGCAYGDCLWAAGGWRTWPNTFNYGNSKNVYAQRDANLSGYGSGVMVFKYFMDTESGYDYFQVQGKKSSDSTWTTLMSSTSGNSYGWTTKTLYFSSSFDNSLINIRFYFHSDSSQDYGTQSDVQGVCIDDVTISATALSTYTVTLSKGTGCASVSPSSKTNYPNYSFSISASGSSGYTFDRWTVSSGSATIADICSQSTTCTIGSSNATVKANYKLSVPTPPSWVTATDGQWEGSVDVTWESVSGATGYELWRAVSSTGTPTKVWEGSGTERWDPAPTTSTYWYKVKAKNSNGTSDYSSANSGYALKAAKPINVAASDGAYTDKVRITWQPGTTGYSTSCLFKILRDGTTIRDFTAGSTSTNTYDDTTVPDASTHTYCVIAKWQDTYLESDQSCNSGNKQSLIPVPPASVTASDGAWEGSVKVNWTASTSTGSAAATGYELWRAVSSTGTPTKVWEGSGTERWDPAPTTSTYWYKVKAKNSNGTSDYSSANSGYALKAAKPINVAASDGAYTDKVRITWQPGTTGYSTSCLFKILRDGTTIRDFTAGSTSTNTYDDTTVPDASTHTYCVIAKWQDTYLESDQSCDSGYASPQPTYTVSGYVRSAEWPNDPLPGVTVSIDGKNTTTSSSGYYSIDNIQGGTKTLSATHDSYFDSNSSFSVTSSITKNITMACLAKAQAAIVSIPDSVYVGDAFDVKIKITNINYAISNVNSYLDVSFNPDYVTFSTPTVSGDTGFQITTYNPGQSINKVVSSPSNYTTINAGEELISASKSGTAFYNLPCTMTIPMTAKQAGTFTVKYRATVCTSKDPVADSSGSPRDQQNWNVYTKDITIIPDTHSLIVTPANIPGSSFVPVPSDLRVVMNSISKICDSTGKVIFDNLQPLSYQLKVYHKIDAGEELWFDGTVSASNVSSGSFTAVRNQPYLSDVYQNTADIMQNDSASVTLGGATVSGNSFVGRIVVTKPDNSAVTLDSGAVNGPNPRFSIPYTFDQFGTYSITFMLLSGSKSTLYDSCGPRSYTVNPVGEHITFKIIDGLGGESSSPVEKLEFDLPIGNPNIHEAAGGYYYYNFSALDCTFTANKSYTIMATLSNEEKCIWNLIMEDANKKYIQYCYISSDYINNAQEIDDHKHQFFTIRKRIDEITSKPIMLLVHGRLQGDDGSWDKQTIDAFEDAGYSVWIFSYPYRQWIHNNGQTNSAELLDKALKFIHNQFPERDINILTYSEGAPVCRWCLENLKGIDGANYNLKYIRRMAMLAGVNHGASSYVSYVLERSGYWNPRINEIFAWKGNCDDALCLASNTLVDLNTHLLNDANLKNECAKKYICVAGVNSGDVGIVSTSVQVLNNSNSYSNFDHSNDSVVPLASVSMNEFGVPFGVVDKTHFNIQDYDSVTISKLLNFFSSPTGVPGTNNFDQLSDSDSTMKNTAIATVKITNTDQLSTTPNYVYYLHNGSQLFYLLPGMNGKYWFSSAIPVDIEPNYITPGYYQDLKELGENIDFGAYSYTNFLKTYISNIVAMSKYPDSFFTFASGAMGNEWWSLYLPEGDYWVRKHTMGSTNIAQDEYGGLVHIKKGQTTYFEVGNWTPAVNHPPVVTNVQTSGNSGDITVSYDLSDADGDACSIQFEYIYDGSIHFRSPEPVVGSLSNLTPGHHTFTWKSADCFSDYKPEVRVRILPTDGNEWGSYAASPFFSVNNAQALLTSLQISPIAVDAYAASGNYSLSLVTALAKYSDNSSKAVAGSWTVKSGPGNVSGALYSFPTISSDTTAVLTCSYQEGGIARTADLTIHILKSLLKMSLNPTTINIQTSSTSYDLSSIVVTASYNDLSTSKVSGTWSVDSGSGSVNGNTFTVPSTAGITKLKCRYTEGGVTASAILTVIIGIERQLTGIGLEPHLIQVTTADSTYELNQISVTAAYSDGSNAGAAGVSWYLTSGEGSVIGSAFNIPTSAGVSVITCGYDEGGVTKTSDLTVSIIDSESSNLVISGTVTPVIEGAAVKLFHDSIVIADMIIDGSGNFSFTVDSYGSYGLTAYAEGYYSEMQEVTVSSTSNNYTSALQFEKVSDSDLPPLSPGQPQPSLYGGAAKIDHDGNGELDNVVQGDVITVKDSSGNLLKTDTVTFTGCYSIAIPYDDPSTPADEGAVEGESLQFYINDKRISENYTCLPPGGVYVDKDISVPAAGNTTEMCIDLKTGWNLISIPVRMEKDDVLTAFTSINDHLERVIEVSGGDYKFYTPSVPKQFNSLLNVAVGKAYWLKVDSTCQLTVSGSPLKTITYNLRGGWNLIGCWNCNELTLSDGGAAPIVEKCSRIIEVYGGNYRFYDASAPSYFNSLDGFIPGRAYWVKVENAVDLILSN